MCCLCVPLRLGTLWLATWTFVYAFFSMFALASGDVRLLNGGYNGTTAKYSALVGMLGVPFGLCGLLGVYNQQVPLLRIYNRFQYLELLVSVVVFFMDYMELLSCEMSPVSIISQVKFNAPLEALSKKMLCPWGRHAFVLGWIVHFSVDCYYTWVTYVYSERLAENPSHYIHFGGDLGSDAVRAYKGYLGETAGLLLQNSRAEVYGGGGGPPEREDFSGGGFRGYGKLAGGGGLGGTALRSAEDE